MGRETHSAAERTPEKAAPERPQPVELGDPATPKCRRERWGNFVRGQTARQKGVSSLKELGEMWSAMSDAQKDEFVSDPRPTAPRWQPLDPIAPGSTPHGLGDDNYPLTKEEVQPVSANVGCLSEEWCHIIGEAVGHCPAFNAPLSDEACCTLFGPGCCKTQLSDAQLQRYALVRDIFKRLVHFKTSVLNDLSEMPLVLLEVRNGDTVSWSDLVLLIASLKAPIVAISCPAIPLPPTVRLTWATLLWLRRSSCR